MHPTDKTARVAGALYALIFAFAPFSLIYLPGKLIAPENATATATNILASEGLFRLGIVGELVVAVVFLLLAVALYQLLSGVNKNQARVMVGLMVVSVAITFVNALTNIAALTLFRGGSYLSVLDRAQRDALGMLFVNLHDQGTLVNVVPWGLWLLPFGLMVMKSGFLPRILGALLIVNGLAHVAASLTSLLLPEYGDAVFLASTPALAGELWIMLWLLIKGAKAGALAAAAS